MGGMSWMEGRQLGEEGRKIGRKEGRKKRRKEGRKWEETVLCVFFFFVSFICG